MQIVLQEWSSLSVNAQELCDAVGLTAPEAALKLAPFVELQAGFDDTLTIQTKRRIGEVQVGTLVVKVLPRLSVNALLRLIGWVVGVKPHLSTDAMGAGHAAPFTLREALAAGYIMALEDLLQYDLHRRYAKRREILPTLRGRPDFARLSRTPPSQGMPCRFVELTRDTWPNRVLFAAASQAARELGGTWFESKARAMVRMFSGLLPQERIIRAQDFMLAQEELGHREHAVYRPVLDLARMLLVGGGPLAVVGAGGISGWWLDMPSLFERAATQGVKRWAMSHGYHVTVQPRHRRAILDGAWETYREPRPDMEVHDDSGEVVAVVDAKYKDYLRAKPDGSPIRPIDSSDLYQLAFYGLRAGEVSRAEQFHGVFVVCPLVASDEHVVDERYRTVFLRENLPLFLQGLDLGKLPEHNGLALW